MSVDAILAHQAGVISRAQALGAGLSRDAVDYNIRVRRWRPVHPRTYLAAGHPFGDEARVRAAVLWAGEGAVLSGVAAAWWHGMVRNAPAGIAITVRRGSRLRQRAGVRLRCRELHALDVTMCRHLAVTAVPLTLLDAAVESGCAGAELLDLGLQRWVAFPAVHGALRRNGGASAARLLASAADRSAGVAERLLTDMLGSSGAAGWLVRLPVAGHVVGVAFPAAGVAIELDGWARPVHGRHTAEQEQHGVSIGRLGWRVLRYTWHQLVDDPTAVLAEIAIEVSRGMALRGFARVSPAAT